MDRHRDLHIEGTVACTVVTHCCGRSIRFRLVRPTVVRLAVAFLTVLALSALAGALAVSAGAQIAWAPCGNSNDFACGHVTVPLDPSGTVPGTLTLAVRRHRAPVGEARTAIVALAGGPGQSAIPFAEQFAEVLGPIAATRDLIVFDQRGIGLSQALSCHALERPDLFHTFGQAIEACASQLGPARAFYTTAATVADIEAIRQAGGYEKLVLYGTSYGTKVAEEYAQQYPSHVEALVLDSVVPPNGPDPLNRATFAAVPRILRQLCAGRLCAHITSNPVGALTRVVSRMRRGALRGHVIDGEGKAHTVAVSSNDLIGMLVAGDFSPLLRAEFVTAVSAAARSDLAPLARLLTQSSSSEDEREDFDTPLYYATTCEEQAFPWSRAVGPQARIAQATAALKALPASTFAPFTTANALAFSDIPECAHWPFATPAPPVQDAPLPNVPTLILSGAADLRTPTANAREVAAEIPDAHLLVVPYAGHSVLSNEPTPCAQEALQALFAGHTVKPCRKIPTPSVLKPPPLPPLRLAEVSPVEGIGGQPGRTLHAVSLTLGDFARQFARQLTAALGSEGLLAPASLRSGGLRAGWVHFAKGVFTFHDYSYVPGVTISGTVKAEAENLHIGGAAAARGTLQLGTHKTLVGTLGGRHVHLRPANTASAAIVDADAQASPYFGLGGAAGRTAAARELLALLGRFLQR
jgi:pimeloyl-ACP methyl ester carboxylesterase